MGPVWKIKMSGVSVTFRWHGANFFPAIRRIFGLGGGRCSWCAAVLWLSLIGAFSGPILAKSAVPEADDELRRRGSSMNIVTLELAQDVRRQQPTISPPRESVSVPDLRRLSPREAAAELREIGLVLNGVSEQEAPRAEPGTILDQRPRPDTRVPRGTPVHVTVAYARGRDIDYLLLVGPAIAFVLALWIIRRLRNRHDAHEPERRTRFRVLSERDLGQQEIISDLARVVVPHVRLRGYLDPGEQTITQLIS